MLSVVVSAALVVAFLLVAVTAGVVVVRIWRAEDHLHPGVLPTPADDRG